MFSFIKKGDMKKTSMLLSKETCVFIPKAYDIPLEKVVEQLGS